VGSDDYRKIAKTCSAFRTALTDDLATRRQRSLVWTIRRGVWHRRKAREARTWIEAAGGMLLSCPLEEMQLPPEPDIRPAS
jgi:hypothetical protein